MKYLHIKLIHGNLGFLIIRKRLSVDVDMGDFVSSPLFRDDDSFRVVGKKRDYAISDIMSLEFDKGVSADDCRRHVKNIKDNGWMIYRHGGFWCKDFFGISIKDRIKSKIIRLLANK